MEQFFKAPCISGYDEMFFKLSFSPRNSQIFDFDRFVNLLDFSRKQPIKPNIVGSMEITGSKSSPALAATHKVFHTKSYRPRKSQIFDF